MADVPQGATAWFLLNKTGWKTAVHFNRSSAFKEKKYAERN